MVAMEAVRCYSHRSEEGFRVNLESEDAEGGVLAADRRKLQYIL